MYATSGTTTPHRPRPTRLATSRASRRPQGSAAIHFALGAWLVILTGLMCTAALVWSAGFWWGTPLIAVAALHFRAGYRLQHTTRS
jgi:hypothetical protein